MPLLSSLRTALGEPDARAFQLMGDDLVVLSGAALREAAERYEAELAKTIPADLRDEREGELATAMADAHGWLRRYNRALPARIQGYLALGQRCSFEYPWPVVALVGLCAVVRGMARWRMWGVLGELGARAGFVALRDLARGLDDTLLRTNRSIFADSVPTVILALHANALRERGRGRLAEALLDGPLPPIMDEESRALGTALYRGLAIADRDERFHRLARVTLQHFAREQAVFSYQMGAARPARPSALESLARLRSIEAPYIARRRGRTELVFRTYTLPRGFLMEDHVARVHEFGRAFVESITGTREEYEAAKRYVLERFGA